MVSGFICLCSVLGVPTSTPFDPVLWRKSSKSTKSALASLVWWWFWHLCHETQLTASVLYVMRNSDIFDEHSSVDGIWASYQLGTGLVGEAAKKLKLCSHCERQRCLRVRCNISVVILQSHGTTTACPVGNWSLSVTDRSPSKNKKKTQKRRQDSHRGSGVVLHGGHK